MSLKRMGCRRNGEQEHLATYRKPEKRRDAEIKPNIEI